SCGCWRPSRASSRTIRRRRASSAFSARPSSDEEGQRRARAKPGGGAGWLNRCISVVRSTTPWPPPPQTKGRTPSESGAILEPLPPRPPMPFDLDDATAVLARTPAVLDAWLRGLPDAWARADEGPGTWSPFDVVGHLIHGERTDWLPRARIILAY